MDRGPHDTGVTFAPLSTEFLRLFQEYHHVVQQQRQYEQETLVFISVDDVQQQHRRFASMRPSETRAAVVIQKGQYRAGENGVSFSR